MREDVRVAGKAIHEYPAGPIETTNLSTDLRRFFINQKASEYSEAFV